MPFIGPHKYVKVELKVPRSETVDRCLQPFQMRKWAITCLRPRARNLTVWQYCANPEECMEWLESQLRLYGLLDAVTTMEVAREPPAPQKRGTWKLLYPLRRSINITDYKGVLRLFSVPARRVGQHQKLIKSDRLPWVQFTVVYSSLKGLPTAQQLAQQLRIYMDSSVILVEHDVRNRKQFHVSLQVCGSQWMLPFCVLDNVWTERGMLKHLQEQAEEVEEMGRVANMRWVTDPDEVSTEGKEGWIIRHEGSGSFAKDKVDWGCFLLANQDGYQVRVRKGNYSA